MVSITFKEFTRDDILQFLDSLRKPEVLDPLHKWIGTYNIYRVLFIRFFKWLYYPNIEQKKRPKSSVIENIALLKRREQSIYKPSDLWTIEDDLLFLKYCPSARERCYHTISRDLSCRSHEILKLRLKDIHFKNSSDCQYAEVLLNGKTGNRNIPLISSLPYLKDWIDQHPQSGNPNGQLICGLGKTLGRRLTTHAVYQIYKNYREKVFPKLLDNPSVPPEDIAASAKSMFLLQMQKKLEDTYYVDCTNASGPGMVEYLFKNDVKYLLLDEVEKMSKSDQNVLLNVLETGILTSTKVKKTGSKKMDISVYATTNDIDAISKPFRSRFVELSLPGYNFDEFCEIAVKLTEQRDGHDRKIAVKIADTVWNKLNSRDVRDIIQISKLTMSIDDVDFLANTLQKYKKKIEREGQDVG